MPLNPDFLEKCFYFGCWSKDKIGHYLYGTNGYKRSKYSANYPLPFNSDYLDGFFSDRQQSRAHLIHIKDWTIIWMYDTSADNRPASNASFIIQLEKLSLELALKIAREAFPDQIARIEALAPIHE